MLASALACLPWHGIPSLAGDIIRSMQDFTPDQLNAFVMRKQHLTPDTKADSIIQVVRDIFGLHATSATTPYLSLLQRMRSFHKEELDIELYRKKSLGRVRCVRGTVYIVPVEMIPTVLSATRRMVEPISEKYRTYVGVNKDEYDAASLRIIALLAGRGMTAGQLRKALDTDAHISSILNLMCDRGFLVRGKPLGGWKSNLHTYHRLADYYPGMDINAVSEEEARKALFRQYLAAFGPVTENDIAWWTGFPRRDVRKVMGYIENEVTMFGNHIMLSAELPALESVPPLPEPTVSFLPTLDPYLMGYRERVRYLYPEDSEYVFDRSGNAVATILLNGMVMGVWDFAGKPAPALKYLLFRDVKGDIHQAIEEQARLAGMFIGGGEVSVKQCREMVPLTRQKTGAALSPLKGC